MTTETSYDDFRTIMESGLQHGSEGLQLLGVDDLTTLSSDRLHEIFEGVMTRSFLDRKESIQNLFNQNSEVFEAYGVSSTVHVYTGNELFDAYMEAHEREDYEGMEVIVEALVACFHDRHSPLVMARVVQETEHLAKAQVERKPNGSPFIDFAEQPEIEFHPGIVGDDELYDALLFSNHNAVVSDGIPQLQSLSAYTLAMMLKQIVRVSLRRSSNTYYPGFTSPKLDWGEVQQDMKQTWDLIGKILAHSEYDTDELKLEVEKVIGKEHQVLLDQLFHLIEQ